MIDLESATNPSLIAGLGIVSIDLFCARDHDFSFAAGDRNKYRARVRVLSLAIRERLSWLLPYIRSSVGIDSKHIGWALVHPYDIKFVIQQHGGRSKTVIGL